MTVCGLSTSAPTITCSSLSSGGHIDVSIRRRDGRFVVEVSNTGALLPRTPRRAYLIASFARGKLRPNWRSWAEVALPQT